MKNQSPPDLIHTNFVSQIEQFIESIYPSQEHKKLTALYGDGSLESAEELKKQREAFDLKKESFYLVAAVLGTLFVISALMVRFPVTHRSRTN